jgi:hypothetical protein
MMFDGVIPLGEALRPLGLSGPSTGRRWRQEAAGSRPRRIGVTKGCARTGSLIGHPSGCRRSPGERHAVLPVQRASMRAASPGDPVRCPERRQGLAPSERHQ